MPRLVDLSHAVRDGLVTYPGLPAPRIRDHLSREASRARYAPGTEFQIAEITLVANTGTYLDAPSHRYAGAPDLAALPLASLADLPGLIEGAGPAPGATGTAGRAARARSGAGASPGSRRRRGRR